MAVSTVLLFTSLSLGYVSTDWLIVGVGDFNGDGYADIVWNNSYNTKDPELWISNPSTPLFYTTEVLSSVGSSTKLLQGVADFNGDGKSDMIWRDPTYNEVEILETNSSTQSNPVNFNIYYFGTVSSDWVVSGVGNFTSTGEEDVIWRNSNTGDVTLWEPVANSGSYSQVNFGNVSLDWKISGTGDFNGVLQDGILWRNSKSGNVTIWEPNAAGTAYNAISIGSASVDWQINGVGDFNGDGQADILWRNTFDGDVVVWLLNSTATGYTAVDLGYVSLDWNIAGVGDFNGDKNADIIWRNNNGYVTIWNSNANN